MCFLTFKQLNKCQAGTTAMKNVQENPKALRQLTAYERFALLYTGLCVSLLRQHFLMSSLICLQPHPTLSLHHFPALLLLSRPCHSWQQGGTPLSPCRSLILISLFTPLSPRPFLPLHPSFLSFLLFVPLSAQPRVAIETDLFEIGGKENYFSLAPTLPPFRSVLDHRVSSPAAFIQLIFNIIYLCESLPELLLPWLLWEHWHNIAYSDHGNLKGHQQSAMLMLGRTVHFQWAEAWSIT